MAPFVEFQFFSLFFFFPKKSLQATHSAERRSTSKKRSKTVKNGTFCRISVFFVVFFFPKKLDKILFFFPGKVHTSLTHSISEGGKKKNSAGKKKTAFLLTHSFFHEKFQILNFSAEKKNGTFALGKPKKGISFDNIFNSLADTNVPFFFFRGKV